MNLYPNLPPLGSILYTTRNGVNYYLTKIKKDGSIQYSINQSRKTLPSLTVITAINDQIAGMTINRKWYQSKFPSECQNRPCNVKVLESILLKKYL